MALRFWFVCLFLHLKVSLQGTVEIKGVVGDSVILPCSYEERVLKNEEINVFWRYKLSNIVYDIINGLPSTEKQDQIFKDRIESFVPEIANGNFSLTLKNLSFTDAGEFFCSIVNVNKSSITLQVRAKPTPEPTFQPMDKTGNSSMNPHPERIVTVLIAVLGIILHYI